MFELSQLRCFKVLAEELHFGRAARRLHMSQPPLSRQMQMLEHELGVLLFERTTRSVSLTAAGRSFLPEAERLLSLADGAALSVRQVARGEAGSIRLGFTAGSSYAFLPRLVALTAASMPDTTLVLREMPTVRQMEALAAGRLDAGLVRLPIDRRGVDIVRVGREPILLAIRDGHKLAARDTPPSLRHLANEPFIMYSPEEGRYFHDLVSALFQAAKIAPEYVQLVSQVHTALALVRSGIGVALVPEAARSLLVQGVTLRALRPAPKLEAELYLVWRRDLDNPAFRSFRDLLVPQLAEP